MKLAGVPGAPTLAPILIQSQTSPTQITLQLT